MVSQKAKQYWANTYRGRRSPLPIDHIGHMDLKVGVVRDVLPDPLADHKNYLTAVNFGGVFSEVVVAQLVHDYDEEALIDKLVVCVCNMKVAWAKGNDSYVNILAGTSPEQGSRLELLIPPEGSEPGDKIIIPEFPPDPDTPFIDPKAGIWEAITEHVKINDRYQILFKSNQWIVENKAGHVHTGNTKNGYVRIV